MFHGLLLHIRVGISPIHVHRMRYKTDVPRRLPCPVCKNEIENKPHVLSDAMHMTALEKM